MVSTVKVDVVAPRVATGTTTLGVSGDKLLIPSGVTITNSGTQSGFSTPTGLSSVQVFTTSGTWTRPTGITKVMMYVTGGGGGGKTNAPSASTGGHSGTTAIKFLDVSSVATAVITVGAAGAGGSSPTAGGNSIWVGGSTITGLGGPAGTAGATNTTPRVVSTGGDINTYSSVTYGATYMTAGSYWGGGSSETTARNYGEGGYSAYVGTGYAGVAGVIYVMEY